MFRAPGPSGSPTLELHHLGRLGLAGALPLNLSARSIATTEVHSMTHAYRNDVKRLRLILTTCAVDPNLETLGSESGKTPLHWLCLGQIMINSVLETDWNDMAHHEEDKEKKRHLSRITSRGGRGRKRAGQRGSCATSLGCGTKRTSASCPAADCIRRPCGCCVG